MPACKDQGYYFKQPAMEGRQGGRRGRLVTKFATREWTTGGWGGAGACGWHREASGSSATSKVLRKYLLLYTPKGCDSVVNFAVMWWQNDVIGDKRWIETTSPSWQKFSLHKVNQSRGNTYCAIYSFIHSQLTQQAALLPGFWVTVSIATKQTSPWSRHNNLLLK